MKEKIKKHFSLIVQLISVGLLLLGFYYLEKRIVITIVSLSVLLFFMVSFYLIYFSKYQQIIDASEPNEFYFRPCRFGNIVIHSMVFLGVFTLLGATLDVLSPDFGFNKAGSLAIFTLLSQSILDGLTFGLLSRFAWTFATTKVTNPAALSLIYLATLLICVGLFAALFARIKEKIDANKLVDELIHGESLNQDYFKELSASKLKGLQKKIISGEIDLDVYGEELVLLLMNDMTKPARTVFLTIMQLTEKEALFTACLDYFVTVKDSRFKRVCESIESESLKTLLHLRGLIDVERIDTNEAVTKTTPTSEPVTRSVTSEDDNTGGSNPASGKAKAVSAPVMAETELYDVPPEAPYDTEQSNENKKHRKNKNKRKRNKNRNNHNKQRQDDTDQYAFVDG